MCLREVRLHQTQPNRIGRFDYDNFNYKTSKWPVPNQSNEMSMMQPYLPLALALPGVGMRYEWLNFTSPIKA